MSIKGSLLTYENDYIVNKLKKRNSHNYSSNFTSRQLTYSANSMEKTGPSPSNLCVSKNDLIVGHKQQEASYFKNSHFPAKYMNSRRKRAKNNSMYAQMYPDHNYLHLNSLWSIWYGVLLTLFQGYLAVHGTARFLGCSLIQWKIEPVAELNLQIILSGLVFVLLPFFFMSAVFKVGNLANDGFKLGNISKERICPMIPHDGLKEKLGGGALRSLWTHGGPTAAFIHIIIAMCLLLPRLLLEARIIENGLLPRETIWRTELDFVTINRRNLVALSIKSPVYQNSTSIELQGEKYLNDTIYPAQLNNGKNTTSLVHNFKQSKKLMTGNAEIKYFELSDFKQTTNDSNKVNSKYTTKIFATVSPSFTSAFKYEEGNIKTSTTDSKTKFLASAISTTDTNYVSTYINKDIRATNENYDAMHSAQKTTEKVKNVSESVSLSQNQKIIFNNQQQYGYSHHQGKSIRRHHRQRKIASHLEKVNSHHQNIVNQKPVKISRQLKNLHQLTPWLLDKNNSNLNNFHNMSVEFNGENIYEHRPSSYEVLDYGNVKAPNYPKSSTTRLTTRDSNIHIVKPEKLPEIIPSTPFSSNSKIIEIRQKTNKKIKRDILQNKENQEDIEPEYPLRELNFNDSIEYIAEINSIQSSTTSVIPAGDSEYDVERLGGFAGMLQLFFGIEKPIDVKGFKNSPSAEFVNLLFALLVWCVRYPAVFWTTAKSFAAIFSVQMIASAADIIFSFVGISSLFKLQIYSQGQPVQNPGLILNASITLALFLLSVILILSSSMALYMYGHGRLTAKIRDRSIISLNSNESWIYFAHCASLCYVLALGVVKAPLLNDLSASYRKNLHCPTFMAALFSVMHIILWIIVWMALAIKRKWSFKLPPLDTYTIIGKATTQPLLIHNKGTLTNTTTASFNNSMTRANISSATESTGNKISCRNSSSDVLNDAHPENIYWPKVALSSPKLKVTFKKVTSKSNEDHQRRQVGYQEQNNDKRHLGPPVYITDIESKGDDGEYATLKSGATIMVGNAAGCNNDRESSVAFCKSHKPTCDVNVLHLSEHNELTPPPLNLNSTMTITNHSAAVIVNSRNIYANCIDDDVGKMLKGGNTCEEGNVLECVRDNSISNACTRDLEPPLPPAPPKMHAIINNNNEQIPGCMQLSSPPDCLISAFAPVRNVVRLNEARIAPSYTSRCLRRADSGVSQEALTPRSDTNSNGTESTISPPDRAPSESSSGVHSSEEREVIIRHRAAIKPLAKLPPPAIQEEPNGRCTNMRMSSFASGCNANSATLPSQGSNADQKFYYSQHCSTMPLPINSHIHNGQQIQHALYASSIHCMPNVSSFKMPLYANSGVAMSGHTQTKQQEYEVQTSFSIPPSQQTAHISLSNGVHSILTRQSLTKAADSQFSSQIFSKLGNESSLANSTIHEDRDSANYSMISNQEIHYTTANTLH